jgi:hypothetical protein
LLILALALRAIGAKPTTYPDGPFAQLAITLHPNRPADRVAHDLLMRAIRDSQEVGTDRDKAKAMLARRFPMATPGWLGSWGSRGAVSAKSPRHRVSTKN